MIVYSRHKRYKFDPLWLNDIYEQIIAENTVDEIKPLITNPGRLLLSTKGIYFQPYNNIQPVTKWILLLFNSKKFTIFKLAF